MTAPGSRLSQSNRVGSSITVIVTLDASPRRGLQRCRFTAVFWDDWMAQ
jgi:hypothetical protein